MFRTSVPSAAGAWGGASSSPMTSDGAPSYVKSQAPLQMSQEPSRAVYSLAMLAGWSGCSGAVQVFGQLAAPVVEPALPVLLLPLAVLALLCPDVPVAALA